MLQPPTHPTDRVGWCQRSMCEGTLMSSSAALSQILSFSLSDPPSSVHRTQSYRWYRVFRLQSRGSADTIPKVMALGGNEHLAGVMYTQLFTD